jgi:hypothetical protein
MYLYSSLIPVISRRYQIFLPGTVPSFHYHFYLKAIQSVFFPFGLLFLIREFWNWLYTNWEKARGWLKQVRKSNVYFPALILLIMVMDLPFYIERDDFTIMRRSSIGKEQNTDKTGVYSYIIEHIPSDQVILCEQETSIFPVMATERKMVCTLTTFSNPFTNYERREQDRGAMLNYLIKGEPASAEQLFGAYHVNYILLSNAKANLSRQKGKLPGKVIYQNHGYLILSVNDYFSSVLKPILPRD